MVQFGEAKNASIRKSAVAQECAGTLGSMIESKFIFILETFSFFS